MKKSDVAFFLIILLFTTTLQPAFGDILGFSNPINLSNSPSTLFLGKDITAAGDNVYTVWVDNKVGGGDILFRRSIDGGATFEPTINLSNNGDPSLSPHVVASATNVYVIWSDGPENSEEIFLRRSVDGGATFEPTTTNLSNNTGSSTKVSLAVLGSNVFAVWIDNTGLSGSNSDIFFRRSTDGGANFELTKNLSNSATNFSGGPLITASGNNVYVTWIESVSTNNDDIFFRRSIDGGANFELTTTNLSNTNTQDSSDHFILVSGTNVYIAWQEKISDTNDDIFFRRSTDGGANFGNSVPITNNTASSISAKIAASGSNLYVIWQEADPSSSNPLSEIFLKKSTDGGVTFELTTTNLSNTAGSSVFPEIFASGSNLYILWQERITSTNDDILFRTSTDGANFSATAINVSSSTLFSTFQKSAVSGNNVYVSWQERTGSSLDDVFFSRSISSCMPTSGNWDITSSCILQTDFHALEDVTVHTGFILTIPFGRSLDIDFASHHLLVQSGGGVLIKAGGKIF